MSTRIAMYVDGWNMLWSMKRADMRKYGWCDFELLAKQRTGHTDALVTVKFFTSWDTPNRSTPLKKQETWWKAMELKGWEIIKGRFGSTSDEVEEWYRNSGKQWREKMTDVHLASRLIADGARMEPVPGRSGEYRWRPKYDKAVLLTQDTDFVPAVRIAHEEFRRQVHILLPPSEPQAQRNAYEFWKRAFPGRTVVVEQLTQAHFEEALLPRLVKGASGEVVECYHEWICRGSTSVAR